MKYEHIDDAIKLLENNKQKLFKQHLNATDIFSEALQHQDIKEFDKVIKEVQDKRTTHLNFILQEKGLIREHLNNTEQINKISREIGRLKAEKRRKDAEVKQK
jgi:hypothetical protein